MNWFLKLSDMPLPEATEYPKNNNTTLDKYNLLLRKDTVEALKKIYPDLKYIGNGAFGVAYEIPNGNIIKMTDYEAEAKVATKVMKNPNDCCAKVFNVVKINNVWFIEIEKIKLLSISEKKILYKLINNDPIPNEDGYYDEFLKKYNDMVECLKNITKYPDIHSNNIGYNKNNKLVLFDLG